MTHVLNKKLTTKFRPATRRLQEAKTLRAIGLLLADYRKWLARGAGPGRPLTVAELTTRITTLEEAEGLIRGKR